MGPRGGFFLSTVIGLAVGVLNGLLAVGGTLLVPSLVHLLGMGQHRAHGTALWVIVPTSLVSAVLYALRVGLPWEVALPVAAGGVAGAALGARLMRRFSSLGLRRLFGIFLLLAGGRMLLG